MKAYNKSSSIAKGRLFDDQLIECAKNNYNKGRLSALKDELSFWEKSGFTEMLLGFPLIKERIASIQEEIKLIESAGVGK